MPKLDSQPLAAYSWSVGGVVVVVMLPPPQSVLADHPTDLHVHLVVDGVAELYVLIVDCVTTVRQSAWLERKVTNR